MQNYTGSGMVACPCFVAGEEAGAVFDLPPSEYPIEILKIGIGWGSQFGGNPQQIEQAIHIYPAGLPNPGVPIYTLLGPVLTDGAINEYNIEFAPGDKIITSGPFTVTLEFLNNSAAPFGPGPVHDGNGCQPGKNVVKAIPEGWSDACLLGVTGDWVFYVKYRSAKVIAAAGPSPIVFSDVPISQTECDTLYVRNDGCDTLLISGIGGCSIAPFSIDTAMTSHLVPPGDSTGLEICVTPTSAGMDTCTISIVSNADNGNQQIDVYLDMVTGIEPRPTYDGLRYVSVVPNPFNPTTTVHFSLTETMPVDAEIYGVDGKRIRTLARGRRFAGGENTLIWDGRNDNGSPVASGVYVVRLSTPLGTRVTRAVLLK